MDNATLTAFILINQRQRNIAIGVSQDTQLLRGLSAYVRSVQRDQAKDAIEVIVRATWLRAMITELATLSERLEDYITVNIEDDEIRRDGLEAMSNLESYITHLGVELEAIL